MRRLSHFYRLPAIVLLVCGMPALAGVQEITPVTVARSGPAENPEKQLYIVQLSDPPAAAMGEASLLRASSRTSGFRPRSARTRFDPRDSQVQQHVSRLRSKQDLLLLQANAMQDEVKRYSYAFNGFAVLLTAQEAERMRLRKGVTRVWQDRTRAVATSDSPRFLGLFDGDSGLRSARGLDGEDVIIGIIDSGITPGHPSMSDREQVRDMPRLCRQEWLMNSLLGRWLCGKYYDEGPVLYGAPPDEWQGECETGEEFAAEDCNNKLIGARYFRDGFVALGIEIDANDFTSPADADGHGTHVASIAAGNLVNAQLFGRSAGRIQGMAPRARVAVYKACWLPVGALRAICADSDLLAAIDAAVEDGVDIINYSIGNLDYSLTDPDDLALLAAADAGIFTAVSVGNDGPPADDDPVGTIQSPAATPWVTGVGATSRSGNRIAEALRVNKPVALAGEYEQREAGFTPRLIDQGPVVRPLVLAVDNSTLTDSDTDGSIYDACTVIENANELSGNIALVQRGGCFFDVKIANAEAAGAVAVVVYSNDGELITMSGEEALVSVPAVMISQADGVLLRDALLDGDALEITLSKNIAINFAEDGNVLAAFSSRGPDPDFLKPDVVAPGVNILGGYTPQPANNYRGESFQYLTGTSQAAPHVAGVAALLREAHPDWTPAEIKSALMTSARQDILLPDRVTEAGLFDIGAGHIVPNDAFDPGLVFDATTAEFDAFLCGLDPDYETVGLDNCAALALAGYRDRPEAINLPTIQLGDLVHQTTVTRRVRNAGEAGTYTATVNAPDGVSVEVNPDSALLDADDTLTYTVTFTTEAAGLGDWLFGDITWTDSEHSVYSPFAVLPSYFGVESSLSGAGASGTLPLSIQFGYTGTYEAVTSGLSLPCVLPDNALDDDLCTTSGPATVSQDPDRSYVYEVPKGAGVARFNVLVDAADNLHLRFALYDELTDGNDDLDVIVWYCLNNIVVDNECEEDELRLAGASQNAGTSDELIDISFPEPGVYIVDVHGYQTDGASADFFLYAWAFGDGADAGNVTVSGAPANVSAGSTSDLTVGWGPLPDAGLWFGGIAHRVDGIESAEVTLLEVDNNNVFPAP